MKNWCLLHDDDDTIKLKMSVEEKYPHTDSDLTYDIFLQMSDIEYVLMLNGEIKAWVKIDSLDRENPRNGVNLGVVIFDKAPVFKELYSLMNHLAIIFEKVLLFTQKNSTTDNIIRKMNEKFDNKLLKPYLENLIAYKYEKEKEQ